MPVLRTWGSCITRDALEFAADATIAAFASRASIVSACTPPFPQERLKGLHIAPDLGNFQRRVIEDDLNKTGLARLDSSFTQNEGGRQVSGTILIIDLTEERHPLLTDGAGHFVTLSWEARQHTNLEKFLFKRIEPFSPEHVKLVRAFLPTFARKISNLQGIEHIVIHRAFFAGTDSTTIHVNNCLKEFYDILAHHLTKCISIEVPKEMRVSGIMHKWGPYALHMVDEYYKYLLYLISRVLDLNIRINNNTSVQNLEESIFFSDSQKYCDILKDMYRNRRSSSWFSLMQYLYVIERELEIQRRGDYVLKADITPWWLMKKAVKRVVHKTKRLVLILYKRVWCFLKIAHQ